MVWTPEKIEELKVQWSAGQSITQIGKTLGMTRNAVVGKAHRLGLSKRESPIVRGTEPRAVPAPKPAPAPLAVPVVAGTGPRCKWPIGDPKSSEFHFCTAASVEGYPYCRSHCAQAYSGWAAEEAKAASAA